MNNFKTIQDGEIALIMMHNGDVKQLALSTEQHNILTAFVSGLTNGDPAVLMGSEYDLCLKTSITK